ncbi:MAG: cytochrome B5 [Caldibacillus debilis]|jgi:cytochrome c oxidase subunit 2|uniref:Cytochrome aa3 subunit 2 n=1 Tax=Caldibacillus debilis TaxID=301148 RepID=A0A150MDI8_9BACI|nr:cytochrome c oxidase subunit II [Caldibacillus debilis]KYD22319.1 Cytochrome c oxidase (B(O/a)3-type) chain II [Caldibacillus debilis]MBY6271936.1 cytochrome B5 [Bacillaceae bacterium]REJ28680.1 MAG: cytochrome B5 [Caldibacillus debilis]REJ28707.1 MAG: cytochrome B5 [Caldibacillus debilis]
MHKYEKIWLVFGIGALIFFLSVIGVSAFYLGNQPPSCLATIDPDKVDQTAPFNEPGLKKVEGKDWDYELVYVAQAFSYTPNEVEIPKGAKVKFIVTTKDVIHGFEVAGTNVNMMVEPGYISEKVATFDKPGEYLVLCNEYCGAGHHMMYSKIKVVENQ